MAPGRTPGKFEDPTGLQPDLPEGAQRGQIVALFAIFLIGLLGILGLATDVGYTMAAKRAVQGAADAGAINGARMIARYTDAAPTSSGAEMEAALAENTFGSSTPFALECNYIGANWAIVGNCHGTVPPTAVGARLQTKMIIHTFFMQIFPGVSGDVAVTGYAKARVEVAVNAPRNAPLMICGTNAWNVTSDLATTAAASASHSDIVSGSAIRQSAIGQTFRVVDPALAQAGNADCGAKNHKFTG
ncbi:MAG TPA: pilus assembly protein TadG-related protein, partial [Thermomicrobiales bacterium]|nr:pilus assembly protein TadG-related protein [Thermomicrobiales bacterium]